VSSTRKKTTLIILIILFVLLALYFIFLRSAPDYDDGSGTLINLGDIFNPPEEESDIINELQSPAEMTPSEAARAQVKDIAVSFAERFGSYSNQADYQNLIELKPQMTAGLKNWTDNFVFNARKNNPQDAAYYAQITKALAAQEKSYSQESGQAEFLIQCQRQEFLISPQNPRTYYQTLKITLLKVKDAWLVDDAVWQAEGIGNSQ